tara:strand:+ start:184820 stop:185272 length:453 start_codon:yes stop_codon:yes gene_type:complete
MADTPEMPASEDDAQKSDSDAGLEPESKAPSDPSALLASAAAALEHIDDPDFEGPLKDDSSSTPQPKPKSSVTGDYGRAVLSIETPVAVVLAKQKISVERVVNLVPGSMLTFDAHCDEPLTLEAGGHAIAVGETVKIGDKFGLRIRQLLD